MHSSIYVGSMCIVPLKIPEAIPLLFKKKERKKPNCGNSSESFG